MRIHIGSGRTVLYLGVAVFFVSTFVSSLKAEIPYWPLLLHDSGFIWAEIPSIISYRMAIVSMLDAGASALLLLLGFYMGQKCRLTSRFVVVLLISLSFSVLLGLLLGHEIRQIEMPSSSIFNASILYAFPGELSKIVWCMLGLVAGTYQSEGRKPS
jgi:hypothetical protein